MSDGQPDLVFVDVYQLHPLLRVGRQKTWRWRALDGKNFQPMAHSGKTYFNHDDTVDAVVQLFGSNSNVFLREKEHGNVTLRLAHPTE